MKIAIYVRVSTEKQTNENQLEKLEEFAKRQGYEYVIFEEKESTRKTRPVKAKVLKLLRNKEFEAVLVLKLDRWARSFEELIMEMNEFLEKNIGFISMRETIDLTTPSGKLQFRMLAAFADFERDLIRDRVNDGLDRVRNSEDFKSGKKKFGRPKGSPDKNPRKKGGYYMRYMDK